MSRIGIRSSSSTGIGDALIMTSLPQNYFQYTGSKLIDVDRHWCFDFNPYVDRDVECEWVIDPHMAAVPEYVLADGIARNYRSIAEKWAVIYRLGSTPHFQDQPRLYKFENEYQLKRVCVHTTGLTLEITMSERCMAHIAEKYKEYDLIQIGSKSDEAFPGARDLRGLSCWDSAREISRSQVFIGVDSGPSWIASAFPRVQCTVLLSGFSRKFIERIEPMSTKFSRCQWFDKCRDYYNDFDETLNFTKSFREI